jgi:ubiquinone/menaquinone biosynthesis C-methylase UbiE
VYNPVAPRHRYSGRLWSARYGEQILTRLLRFFFHLLYHQFAWTYDLVAAIVSLGRWNNWILETLPYLPETGILELGYGTGHLQAALLARGSRPIGLDESKWMAKMASRRLHRLNYSPNFVNARTQEMPFAEGIYKAIVATFPSDYIFDPNTIDECYRVLQPGGRMFVLPLAWITGHGFFNRLASSIFRVTGQAPEWDERYIEPFNTRGFNSQALEVELHGSKILLLILTRPMSSD